MTIHDPRQQIFAIAASIVIVLLVFELVRRKRLREEYTWLWMLSAATIFLITVCYDLLVAVTRLIGAVLPTTTIFLFGILFLYLISLHYAVKMTALREQVKNLAQGYALLEAELREQGRQDDGITRRQDDRTEK
ncbi:hypothetical protein HRbin17_01331 [bacterium HR17]|uniref:DUF2304 domain-containing protein n=1 Tax=Candidatus Fervidibacter japonicus TaxID=2035412 RepID=A0A2H5XCB1_9BACT|nr:hypothetical protein HRbin17_01331 [bacterium HR17]